MCVCRRDHPIWQTEPVAVSDLVGYPILASGIRHFEIWKTLASSDELERMNRNVPASIIANPLTVLPVLRATEHILMTTEMNWRRVCENNPDLDMLPVFDLRGLAHMRFVTLEGKQRSPLEKALIASFRAAASSLAIPLDAS